MISMAKEFEEFMLWHSSTKASRSIFILKNRDVSTPCKRILGQDWMRLLKSSELRPNSEVRKFKVISIFCLRDRSKISGTVTTKLSIWSLVKLHLCLIIASHHCRSCAYNSGNIRFIHIQIVCEKIEFGPKGGFNTVLK